MLLLLLAHFVIGTIVLLAAPWLKRTAFFLGALPMVATLAYLVSQWRTVTSGGVVTTSATWVERLDLVADARLDGFSLLMALLVSGMGTLVLLYGAEYFAPTARAGRTAGLLVLFAGSMLGLVLADNLIWLYVCWELTSVTSFMLIGGDQATAEQRAAGLQALLVTAAGGLAMLAGFIVLAHASGTWSLHELLSTPPSGTTVGVALGLVLAGIVTKSAQFPFHFWLPGAMVAPTPISAYLHSATMVKAGIYLAARLAPAFAMVGVWRPFLVGIGVATMLLGGWRALRQHDLKLLLAFGTVSQLGLLMVLAGAGHPQATTAAVVLLLAHALFKGALFLVVGIVDHQTGTRDLHELPVLGAGWGAVRVIAVVSTASMAGLPPLLGFVAKEAAYESFLHGSVLDTATLAGLVTGSMLTFAYSVRFLRPFLRRPDTSSTVADAPAREAVARPDPPPALTFVLPAALLALGTIACGSLVGPLLDPLTGAATIALAPNAPVPHLALWHGFNTALALSAVTIIGGALLVLARRPVETLQRRLGFSVTGDDVFGATTRGLVTLAQRVAGTVQSGSLPAYIAVILLTVVGTPLLAALPHGDWPADQQFSEIAAHTALAVALLVGGVAVAVSRRRFAAVLLLGGVGYTMALLFAMQGAPDLALTQFAVETLFVIVFMLVIRHLPTNFAATSSRTTTAVRAGVAGAVGAGVFALALLTGAGSAERPTSDAIIQQAVPEGGGKNVVNVILVDVRGLDTLGEVTVLLVAAIGVTAVARVGRRPSTPTEAAATAAEVTT